MTDTTLAIAPVFSLILLGVFLRRIFVSDAAFWEVLDRLVYWVLIPSLLFAKIAGTSASDYPLGLIGFCLISGMMVAALVAVLSGRRFKLSLPAITSVMQGASRHNSFIALPVSAALLGQDGLELAVFATGMLIPATNVAMVVLMIWILGEGEKGSGRKILRDLLRNPFILSIGAGFLANVSGLGEWRILTGPPGLLGQAALPVMLLAIGASLTTENLAEVRLPMALALFGKFLIFPLVVFLIAKSAGLTGISFAIVMIYAAVPVAASSYALASQLGGDKVLMARIISFETLVAFFTLPLTLALFGAVTLT